MEDEPTFEAGLNYLITAQDFFGEKLTARFNTAELSFDARFEKTFGLAKKGFSETEIEYL